MRPHANTAVSVGRNVPSDFWSAISELPLSGRRTFALVAAVRFR